jgi:hypothetical protein
VFVVKLVAMVLALRMLGFVAAVIALTAVAAVACQRRTDHREYQCYSKDETAQSAPPMRADD